MTQPKKTPIGKCLLGLQILALFALAFSFFATGDMSRDSQYGALWSKRLDLLEIRHPGCAEALQTAFRGGTGVGKDFNGVELTELFESKDVPVECQVELMKHPRFAPKHHIVLTPATIQSPTP